MTQSTSGKPARCLVTKLGILLFAVAAFCFATIESVQFIKTGSFERGNGFVLGGVLATPMLLSLCASLALLAAGGIVDSIRYGKWKRSQTG